MENIDITLDNINVSNVNDVLTGPQGPENIDITLDNINVATVNDVLTGPQGSRSSWSSRSSRSSW